MAISGTSGSVLVNGAPKTGDKWTGNFDQAAVDRMNFTTLGEPSNAAGQRTGEITFEGPYEGVLGMTLGVVYQFRLGVTPAVGIVVNARVTNVTFNNDANGGPRFSVRAAQVGAIVVGII